MYGDLIKEMLAINARANEIHFARFVLRDESQTSTLRPGEIEAARVRRRACEDAYALLLVEPYPVIAPVMTAVDAYRGYFELEEEINADPGELRRLMRTVQYAMGRSTYARGPWGRLQLWRAFRSCALQSDGKTTAAERATHAPGNRQ